MSTLGRIRSSFFARKGDLFAFRVDARDSLQWATFTRRGLFNAWASDETLADEGWEDKSVAEVSAVLATPDAPTLTARQHMEAMWEAAHVPADGRVPAGSDYIRRDKGNGHMEIVIDGPGGRADSLAYERRLIDPARPSGAAALERRINTAAQNMPGVALTPDQRRVLADALATDGVRIPA